MSWVMRQTGRQQVDCSRVVGQQQQKSDRRQWHTATGGRRVDWRLTSAAGLDVSSADQRGTAADPTSTEVQCHEELGKQWPPVWTWCARVLAASESWQELLRSDNVLCSISVPVAQCWSVIMYWLLQTDFVDIVWWSCNSSVIMPPK